MPEPDGAGADRHRRLHRLRRGAHPRARPRAGGGLRRRARRRARRRRAGGLHPHPHALRGQGKRRQPGQGGAGDQAVAGQVLLGLGDAGPDRRDHDRVRSGRYRGRPGIARSALRPSRPGGRGHSCIASRPHGHGARSGRPRRQRAKRLLPGERGRVQEPRQPRPQATDGCRLPCPGGRKAGPLLQARSHGRRDPPEAAASQEGR